MDPRQLDRRGAVDAEAEAQPRDAAAAQHGPLFPAWDTGWPRPRRRKEPELRTVVVGAVIGQGRASRCRRGFGLLLSDALQVERCYAGLVHVRDQIVGYPGRILGREAGEGAPGGQFVLRK